MLLSLFSAFLLNFSAFGAAALLAVGFAMLLERAGGRRPDLEQQRQEEELRRYLAQHTLSGYRKGALLAGVLVSAAVFTFTQKMAFAAVPLLLGFVMPALYPWRVKRKYMAQFERGFIECLDIWVRCLQAGLSLQQAIQAAGADLTGPAAHEMKLLAKEISLGDVEQALWHFYDRMPTEDVRYAVLGVITCRQTGGRISEVVVNIVESIRERSSLRDRIMAITSMGRTEAYIMAVIPVAIGSVMYIMDPDTAGLLFTTTIGIVGTMVAAGWEMIGLLVIWKIVNIKT